MTEWKSTGPWVRVNENDVIEALTGHAGLATYVVANKLRRHEGYRHIKTSAVLSRLKRMEREGMVKRVTDRRNPYARQHVWERARACHTAHDGPGEQHADPRGHDRPAPHARRRALDQPARHADD